MITVYFVSIATCLLFILWANIKPSSSEFYLGKKNYGPIRSSLSIVAAFTGGGALINTTGLASKYGEWAFFDVLPAVLGLSLSAIFVWVGFFGKRFSENFFNVKSDLYDRRAVLLHYVQIAFLYILVVAAQFRAIATVADSVQISAMLAVLACAITVAIYAHRGFDAVTRTDVLQITLMVPMYIILATLAFSSDFQSEAVPVEHDSMPFELILALSLPLFFLPVSQEIHQRGAAVDNNKNVAVSYILAGIIYAGLGSLLVLTFSSSSALSFASIILGDSAFLSVIVTVGLLAAILSTLDTSTNIASHAVQQLPLFAGVSSWMVQAGLLLAGSIIFLFFKTVLSIILFALFLYMAGPAITFVGVFAGIHPKMSATIGATFCGLHAFTYFKGARLIGETSIGDYLPINDPIKMGLLLIITQMVIMFALAVAKKLR